MTTSSDVEQRAEPGGGAAAGLHPFGLCSDWEPDALQFRAEIEVADPPPVDQHAGPEADEVTRIEARLPPDELVSGEPKETAGHGARVDRASIEVVTAQQGAVDIVGDGMAEKDEGDVPHVDDFVVRSGRAGAAPDDVR